MPSLSTPKEITGVPDDWTFTSTKSGWITTDIFSSWFCDVFIPATRRKQRPLLLVMDNHTSHASVEVIDLADKNGINLLFLPPHSSHFLQPLDLGYFNQLKQAMGDISVSLGYGGVKVIPKEKFPKVLQYGMNKVTEGTTKSAFKQAGTFPFKPVCPPTSGDTSMVPASHSAPNDAPIDEVPTCDGCGRSRENPLVKLGIIPSDLADVLVEPPIQKKRRRSSLQKGSRIFKASELHAQKSPSQEDPAITSNQHSDNHITMVSQEGMTVTVTEPTLAELHVSNEKVSSKGKCGKRKYISMKKTSAQRVPLSANRKVPVPISPSAASPQPGPSRINIDVNDSDEDEDVDRESQIPDEDKCCVCKLYYVKRNAGDLFITNWVKCDSMQCNHWVHLKFCTKLRVARANTQFQCPCCRLALDSEQ